MYSKKCVLFYADLTCSSSFLQYSKFLWLNLIAATLRYEKQLHHNVALSMSSRNHIYNKRKQPLPAWNLKFLCTSTLSKVAAIFFFRMHY